MMTQLLLGLGAFVVVDQPCPVAGAEVGATTSPTGLAVAADGTVWVADASAHRLVRLSPDGGVATLGGLPPAAFRLYHPEGVALAADGTLYVADTGRHVVWELPPGEPPIRLAGRLNEPGYSGDGGEGWDARLHTPSHLTVTADDWLLISDRGNHCLRMVRLADGWITTMLGVPGRPGYNGDGLPARRTQLRSPGGVCYAPDGALLIADSGNHRVRRLGRDGGVETLAGGDEPGDAGDDGPCRRARLRWPQALAPLPNDSVVIADTGNRCLRAITSTGRLTRVVVADPSAPPLAAPWGLASTPVGHLIVSDRERGEVRRLAPLFG
jgi:NHL repeat